MVAWVGLGEGKQSTRVSDRTPASRHKHTGAQAEAGRNEWLAMRGEGESEALLRLFVYLGALAIGLCLRTGELFPKAALPCCHSF